MRRHSRRDEVVSRNPAWIAVPMESHGLAMTHLRPPDYAPAGKRGQARIRIRVQARVQRLSVLSPRPLR